MTTPAKPVEPPPYRLEYEPDGSSWTARENLADILERELLGPDERSRGGHRRCARCRCILSVGSRRSS